MHCPTHILIDAEVMSTSFVISANGGLAKLAGFTGGVPRKDGGG